MARRRKPANRSRAAHRPVPPTRVEQPAAVEPESALAAPAPASGSSVGILLAIGTVIGAIAALPTGLPLLAGCGIGALFGAIAGIVIDRRRSRKGATR